MRRIETAASPSASAIGDCCRRRSPRPSAADVSSFPFSPGAPRANRPPRVPKASRLPRGTGEGPGDRPLSRRLLIRCITPDTPYRRARDQEAGWRQQGQSWRPGGQPSPELERLLRILGELAVGAPPQPAARPSRRAARPGAAASHEPQGGGRAGGRGPQGGVGQTRRVAAQWGRSGREGRRGGARRSGVHHPCPLSRRPRRTPSWSCFRASCTSWFSRARAPHRAISEARRATLLLQDV